VTSCAVADAAHRPGAVSIAAWLALALVLAAGAVLRLTWLDDIEFKADEAWTWRHAMLAGRGEPLTWVGMPTSAGPENPGMSLWAFIPLRWLGNTPVDMARGVAWLSIASMAAIVVLACTLVPASEREIWLWAVALEAVHPLSVLHHRKIWPPCLFPLLLALFLACWWRRDRRLSAFCWGMLGPVLAQINLSAAFFAGAFALWTWFSKRSRTAWKSWLAGSVIASLPAIPWLLYVSTVSTQPRLTTLKWSRALEGKFYLRWFTEPFGCGLDHALGEDYLDFLSRPVVGGKSTWLVGALQVAGLVIAVAIAWRWIRKKPWQRPAWRAVFSRNATEGVPYRGTALVCSAAFWGYGMLLTLSCLPLHRQYSIIVYLLNLLWVAYAALSVAQGDRAALRSGRRLLAGLLIVELLISASFLSYIHDRQVIDGDYGVTFAAQRSTLGVRR